MIKELLKVKQVYAGAQDIIPGPQPQVFNVGDEVMVELESGARLRVLIQTIDQSTGATSGEVKNGSTDEVEPSDIVSFNTGR